MYSNQTVDNQQAANILKRANGAETSTAGAGSAAFIPFVKAVGRGEKLKRDLSYEESREALHLIVSRAAADAQIGAFLIAQRVKGEAVDEILGFTDVMREHYIEQIEPRVDGLLDLAAPYDGKAKTAQLAPAVAIMLVAAGVPVVMHGDEGVPTKEGIGPSLVLRALGVPVDLAPKEVERRIETCGFGYLGAAYFAPEWHALLPIRRQFGLRTVLNSVEKLFNPANAPYQVSGFFHANYIERIRSTQTGSRASWMVQGEEGSIEMATGRRTHIYAVDATQDVILDPAELGMNERERVGAPDTVAGHVELNLAALHGSSGTAFEQVALTVGAILSLLGQATDVADGLARAQNLLKSGAAKQTLAAVSGS